MSPVSQQRLQQLYEVSKLLISSGTAEHVFDSALEVICQTLPLRSAILIEQLEDHCRLVLWSGDGDPGGGGARLAIEHVQRSFAYLIGAPSPTALAVNQTLGRTPLPEPRPAPAARPATPLFIVLPLVVSTRNVFGAIQVEAAGVFDEADLGFVSTIVNQLSVAVDRDRSARREVVRRREAEAATEKYESLVDNLDHVFVWEAEAETLALTFLSARAESMLGRPRGEILSGSGEMRLVHPEDRAVLAETLQRVVSEGRDQRCEHRCVTGDGRVLWLHTGIHLASSAAGQRFQGVSMDISAAKQLEDERLFLLEATKTLGATLDYRAALGSVARLAVPRLGDFCFFDVLGSDGQLSRGGWAHVEPAGQRAFERAFAAPSPGSHGGDAPRRVPDFLADARAVLRVPVALAGRKLGELIFAFVGRERRYGAAEQALAEELAQRAAFALENGRLYDESRRAVQVREQVLEVVSHDLRNPLSVVMMATTALVMPGTDAEASLDFDRNVARIQRAGERMLVLINDLLDFGSIEGGTLSLRSRPCDPALLLAEAAAASGASAALHHVTVVVTEPAQALPPVDCDHDRILQVLANLVENAIKVPSRLGVVTLSSEQRAEEIVFAVSDSGPGLGADDLARIFERYQRGTGVQYQGTGLGLSIARGIVRQHGGRLWVESQVGVGATFLVALPLGHGAEGPRR